MKTIISEETIKTILNEIKNEYQRINDIYKEIPIRKNILEIGYSTKFSDKLSKIYRNLNSFSEFSIENKFKSIWKNLKHKNLDKILNKNNHWNIDIFIDVVNENKILILEFKYGHLSLSDLIRTILLMLKFDSINQVFLIIYKDKKLEITKNKEFNVSCLKYEIHDKLLEQFHKFISKKEDNIDLSWSIQNIWNSFEKESDWRCLNIFKKEQKEILNDDNFNLIGSFIHTIKETNLNIEEKRIEHLLERFDELNVEKIFKENSFNKINDINFESLLRKNVLKNFFNKDPEYEVVNWIIEFIENLEVNKNFKELINIRSAIKNNNFEETQKILNKSHENFSFLLANNKKIKKEIISRNKNIQDKTTTILLKNNVTLIIKKTIYDFLIKFKIGINDKIKDFFNIDVDVNNMIKNDDKLKERAEYLLSILYVYSKILLYNKKINNFFQDEIEFSEFLKFINIFKQLNYINPTKFKLKYFEANPFFNLSYYLGFLDLDSIKKLNSWEQIVLSELIQFK